MKVSILNSKILLKNMDQSVSLPVKHFAPAAHRLIIVLKRFNLTKSTLQEL